MTSRCRVLVADHCSDFLAGGAQRVLLDLLSSFDPSDLELHAAFPFGRDGALARALPPGVRHHAWNPRVPDGSGPKLTSRLLFFLNFPGSVLFLAKTCRRFNIDVLYANTLFSAFALCACKSLLGIPMVFHEHDIHDSRPSSWVWRTAFRTVTGNVDRIVAISQAVKGSMIANGVASEKIRVIHNGVRTATLSKSEFEQVRKRGRERLSIREESTPVVGLVGHYRPWKGHLEFLKTFPHVCRDVPDVRYLLVGDPAIKGYHASVRDYAASLNHEGHVLFLGFQENIDEILAAVDIFVSASNPEPFGLVVLEAMRLARPVVAFDVGGPAEIIQSGTTGILVEPGHIDGLARAIVSLLQNQRLAVSMGVAAQESIERNFSLQRQATAIRSLLRELEPRHDAGAIP